MDNVEVVSDASSATEVTLTVYPIGSGVFMAKLKFEYEWNSTGSVLTVVGKEYLSKQSGRPYCRFHLMVESDGNWHQMGDDYASQDEAWHSVSTRFSTNSSVSVDRIQISVRYWGGNGSSDLKNHIEISYSRQAPSITKPNNGEYVRPELVVSGRGTVGAEVAVYRGYQGDLLSDPILIDGSGTWTRALLAPLQKGEHFLTAQQIHHGVKSEFASNIRVIVDVLKPEILEPGSGSEVGAKPRFSGKGVALARIQIHRSGSGVDVPHPTTYVSVLGTWSLSLDDGLSLGTHGFTATQTLGGITSPYADDIEVIVVQPNPPRITYPPAGSELETSFTLTGDTLRIYNDILVFKDGNRDDEFGRSSVTSIFWTCRVEVPPGPISLVAIQIDSLEESRPSLPRAFKIRPPALTDIIVTNPTEASIMFSGAGYNTATVQISIVSGPEGATPPPTVEVANGSWRTTATNWPFGSYSLKAIQKVSDRAGGWIESQPYTFTVNRVLPDVSDVTYTQEYRPTISGKGYTGARVRLANPGGATDAAPPVNVMGGGWSSQVTGVWGPTFKREVHIKQSLDGQSSPNWYRLEITIPPLAPVMNPPVENGLSPNLSGTCWHDAVLKLKYSDSATEHPVTNNNGNWTFRRETPFAPDITHTATLIQHAASQDSPGASRTFTVSVPMLQPIITHPDPGEVGRDVIIRGQNGMAGATMQLHDAQFGRPLGASKVLATDGEWFIELTGLEFREYTVDAQQTLGERPSEHSDRLVFTVVLLPPEFEVPQPGGKLPRTSRLSGRGMRNGRINVWLQGRNDPLLENIPVDFNGDWAAEVTLPVGETTVRARQFFVDENGKEQTSAYSDWLVYNVVPAAPFIETPAMGEHIGRRVVVSGFGVPGDTVTVRLGGSTLTVLGSGPVLEDRTWSVTVTLDQPGGAHGLVAVAESEGFESDDSAPRAVVLGTYLPSIDVPASGHWVDNPVGFEGRGRPGVGQVVSWYNPDRALVAGLEVNTGAWHGEAVLSLPGGGHWCRFKQTLTDSAGDGTVSDWVESGRFDVPPRSSQP